MTEQPKFEQYCGLDDSDAFENVASKVLGDEKYEQLKRETAMLPKKMANDAIVDEVFRKLNRPIVKFVMRFFS